MSDQTKSATATRGRVTTATRFAFLDVAWLLVLGLLLCMWWRGTWVLDEIKDPLGGVVPLIVPWAGALGGVTISLMGTAKHTRDWDDAWNVWHLVRPFMGMVAGTVAYLMVVVVLRAAGGLKEQDAFVTLTPVSIGLFFVIAFIVGFRDKVFLELVSKVATVVFSNGDAEAEDFAYALDVATLDFGQVPVRTDATREVRATVTAGQPQVLDSPWWRIEPAKGAFRARHEERTRTLGDIGLEVVFAPKEPGTATARLVTSIGGVEHAVSLRGEGTSSRP
jgi:hypothetical protein